MESKKDGVHRIPMSKEDYDDITKGCYDDKDIYVAESKRNSKENSGKSSKLDIAEEKERILELQQEIEVNKEFERLKLEPTVIAPSIAKTKFAKNFLQGFKIVSMNMRDASTGKLIWRSTNWDVYEMFETEIKEEIPKEILNCRAVSREIMFSSEEEMTNFRLEQRIYFHGTCIEQWFFKFGYVMAGSKNSWQQTIEAAPPSEMLSSEALSGNVVFETAFFDDKEFLCKTSVRIYYV